MAGFYSPRRDCTSYWEKNSYEQFCLAMDPVCCNTNFPSNIFIPAGAVVGALLWIQATALLLESRPTLQEATTLGAVIQDKEL